MTALDESARIRLWLCAVLFASALLRVVLVLSGGHLFWPDEGVHDGVAAALAAGDADEAVERLQDEGHHFIFRFIWLIPDTLAFLTGIPEVPALFFGLISVVNIWLVWLIARRSGASEPEALMAAGLLAASVTFFYYARHFLPYDSAMAFGLLALYVGLRPSPRIRDSVMCGLLAGAAFITYAGYWTLSAVALLLHTIHGPMLWRDAGRRGVVAGIGMVAFLASAHWVHGELTGLNLLQRFVGYGDSVNQGVFAEGWRLPFEYLWHAEHMLLVLWGAALASCLWHLRSERVRPVSRNSVVAICVIYGAFVLFSVVLERFVVYGRLVRQLVPFFCLIAAPELERLRRISAWRPLMLALSGAVLIQAGANFWQPLHQTFPTEFRNRVSALVGTLDGDVHRWINVKHIYPLPEEVVLPPHTVLYEEHHPLEFVPYLYEGYTPQERAAFRFSDIRMRLVAVEIEPAAASGGDVP